MTIYCSIHHSSYHFIFQLVYFLLEMRRRSLFKYCIFRSPRYVLAPSLTPQSKEIAGFGPALVYYTPPLNTDANESADATFGFQIMGSWIPMLISTAAPFTRIVCQGTTPIFIPADVEIRVKEIGVTLILLGDVKLVKHFSSKIRFESDPKRAQLPCAGYCTMYTADPEDIDEDIVAIITSGMEVFCAGAQTVHLYCEDTVVIRDQ